MTSRPEGRTGAKQTGQESRPVAGGYFGRVVLRERTGARQRRSLPPAGGLLGLPGLLSSCPSPHRPHRAHAVEKRSGDKRGPSTARRSGRWPGRHPDGAPRLVAF